MGQLLRLRLQGRLRVPELERGTQSPGAVLSRRACPRHGASRLRAVVVRGAGVRLGAGGAGGARGGGGGDAGGRRDVRGVLREVRCVFFFSFCLFFFLWKSFSLEVPLTTTTKKGRKKKKLKNSFLSPSFLSPPETIFLTGTSAPSPEGWTRQRRSW